MDFSGGKTLSSTQANENSCVPTALGSNVHAAAELAQSCTFMQPLGIPDNCRKRPNPWLITNLSETEVDSQRKKKNLNSQLWKQLSVLNMVIMNRGTFDPPRSSCRDKSNNKSCWSGDSKKILSWTSHSQDCIGSIQKGASPSWWSGFVWFWWDVGALYEKKKFCHVRGLISSLWGWCLQKK